MKFSQIISKRVIRCSKLLSESINFIWNELKKTCTFSSINDRIVKAYGQNDYEYSIFKLLALLCVVYSIL